MQLLTIQRAHTRTAQFSDMGTTAQGLADILRQGTNVRALGRAHRYIQFITFKTEQLQGMYCDLARLAGYEPAAVLVDVLNDDGSLAMGARLHAFAERNGLRIGTIADLIHFRLLNETTVQRVQGGEVKTAFGVFEMHVFRELDSAKLHMALTLGDIEPHRPCLVRVHLAAALRDLLWTEIPGQLPGWNSARCLERIAAEREGVFVLLDQRESEQHVLDTIEVALGRQPAPETAIDGSHNVYNLIGVGSQILRQLGVGKMRVMGPPIRYNAISGFGLEVVEHLSC